MFLSTFLVFIIFYSLWHNINAVCFLSPVYFFQGSDEDAGAEDYEDADVGEKRKAKGDKAPALKMPKKTPKVWTIKDNTFYIEKYDEESGVATLSNGVEITLEKGENPEEAIEKISQLLPAMLIPKK